MATIEHKGTTVASVFLKISHMTTWSVSKISCCLEGFLVCSLHCSTLLLQIPLNNSVNYRKISEFTFLGWYSRLLLNNSVSSNTCFIDWRWHTVLSMLVLLALIVVGGIVKQSWGNIQIIYACFHIASQSVQHLRWLLVITYVVHLAKLMKLDTLPSVLYYELLL